MTESTPLHLRHITITCAECGSNNDGVQYATRKGWVCSDCQEDEDDDE